MDAGVGFIWAYHRYIRIGGGIGRPRRLPTQPFSTNLANATQETSPLPRKVSLFGGSKSGEKKRLIAKLQAQMQVLVGDRKALAARVHKAGQTGGVALAMLKEEWAASQAALQAKVKELEEAQGALARHEAETLQLRTSVTGLRKQIDELKVARQQHEQAQQAQVAAMAPTPVLVAALVQQEAAEQNNAALVEQQARLEELESELDLAYGKIEALSLQQSTSMDHGTVLVRQLQAEVKEAKVQLAARIKKVGVERGGDVDQCIS